MLQTVVFYRIVVEPCTLAGSPSRTTNHAEFGPATTIHALMSEKTEVHTYENFNVPCHVVAALHELDHSLASITPLPTLVFGLSNKFCRVFIIGTIPTTMVLHIALDTNLGTAFHTPPIFPSVTMLADVLGPNELAAVLLGAV